MPTMDRYLTIFLTHMHLFFGLSILLLAEQAPSPSSSGHQPNGVQQPPSVMLAIPWDEKTDIAGWWMSEKLDGVRGYWTGKKLVSRSGIPFHVPTWFTENFPSTPLDGELWLGRQRFSELVSIVRRNNADDQWKDVRYFIFDVPELEMTFEKRLEFARNWFRKHPSRYAEVLKQEVCENADSLRKKLTEIELLGGEGIMLRRPHSRYTSGRSSDLLKVKSYADMEATVIRHLPGSGRNKGRLGSLLVELTNGIQFAIGTGFSDQERDAPPPIGSVVTFKYYGFNKSGVPRFASFLRIREEL